MFPLPLSADHACAATWHATSDVLREQCDALFAIGHRFFSQPTAAKEENLPTPGSMTGWRSIGIEYSQHPSRPDLNETFCYRSRDLEVSRNNANESLIEACRDVQEGLDTMAATMLQDLATRCGVTGAEAVVRTFGESWLQLNNSHPGAAEGKFIQEDHEDGHLLTILMADAPGLEVLLPSGDWAAVSPTTSTVIAFAGECGALLTNDLVTPTRHRVRADRAVETRMSVAYFVNPDTDQVLTPWASGPRNRNVDLVNWGRNNPARFGLPVL